MPLSREEKQKIIKDLRENFQKQKAVIFVAIRKVGAEELSFLRRKLKQEKASLVVAKKTLTKLALDKRFLDEYKRIESEDEPLAAVFCFDDVISPLKVIYGFSQQYENLKILGGFFENSFMGKESLIELAQLPPREQLLSRLCSSLNAPLVNLINVLKAILRKPLFVLNRISSIKGQINN